MKTAKSLASRVDSIYFAQQPNPNMVVFAPRVLQGSPPLDAPHVPVVIVGGGACGLVAAITLRDAGIDCVVLERDAQCAGSTALSSGFIPAAGTLAQRAAGIQDSAAAFAQDIQNKAHQHAAPHLVRAYTQAIAPALDNLQSHHGIEFQVLDGFLYPGHSVRRMHAVREKTGAALVTQLERAATQAGADILNQATVCDLWCDAAQSLKGVSYVRPNGEREHLRCDALILACNGFGGNPSMVREFLPEMQHALFAGHSGNDGSAVAWGLALNAGLADMQAYQGHGAWAVPQGALITWALMMAGGIQLNQNGQRFHDETQGYSEAAMQVLAQPQGLAWLVFDAEILKLARTFPDFCVAENAGALKMCADINALSALIGGDVAQVEAACLQTHRGIIANTDANLNSQTQTQSETQTQIPKRALQAPFYAIKVTGALFHTQGGLAVDAACRVLHQTGRTFENLFAAGGAARGVSGHAVWGYLSGNGLLSAVAGGAIAAQSAIMQVQKPQ